MRLDQYLVLHYNFTRNKAQQIIIAHLVCIDAKICNKPSYNVREDSLITITSDRRVDWVSRSAEKLAGFLENLPNSIDMNYAYCLDVGSSTGWFTQVLLSVGADHIDAVDVGTDQLHHSLQDNPKVSSYEKIDIRDYAKQYTSNRYDVIVCDASFISLYEIFDAISSLADSHTKIILLYKPQFEVWRENLRKTGVPKNLKIVEQKMKSFEDFLISMQTEILACEKSTLMGEAGNQEWIYMIQKKPQK